jgi:hypothetical protein
MNYLSSEVIISEISKVRPGSLVRIGYTTSVPVKAEYKKVGYKVTKVVLTTVRTGVKYDNIATVIARRAELMEEVQSEPKKERANNYVPLIPNKVYHNSNTGKDYLYVASFNKGHNTFVQYVVEDPKTNKAVVMTKEEFMGSEYKTLPIDSYYKRADGSHEVFNISFENVYKIGNVEA